MRKKMSIGNNNRITQFKRGDFLGTLRTEFLEAEKLFKFRRGGVFRD